MSKNALGGFAAVGAATTGIDEFLLQPGLPSSTKPIGGMESAEVERLFSDLDIEIPSKENDYLASLIWQNAMAIRDFVRLEKVQPGAGGSYTGIYANNSTDLEMWPLRPKDVGNATLLNTGALANKGLYGGVNAAVFDWTTTVTAGTVAHIVPSQTLIANSPPVCVLLLGAIERKYTPKIGGIICYKTGNQLLAPQPVNKNYRSTFGENTNISVFRFKLPIVWMPNELMAIDVMPDVSGTTNFELIAFICTLAQYHTL
jgi:hypothetical protein